MGQEGGYGRHQRLAKRVLSPLFKVLWSIEVNGAEHLPSEGPAVLCPNHLAAIDSFVVPAVLDRRVIFVGKAEYLDDWKTRWLFPALGMIPIDRRGGEHAADALAAARGVLRRGDLFAIYPEGTRSRTGDLHRGHTGAARLAIETGAPIVPIGLVGTDGIQPVNTSVPRLFRSASVNIGKPIEVGRYVDRVGDRAVHRELIDEVMFEIQALSGQRYVPHYAGSAAAGSAAVPAAISEDEGVAATVPRRSSRQVLVARPMATTNAG